MLITKYKKHLVYFLGVFCYIFLLQNCYAAELVKVGWYNTAKNIIQFEIFVNGKVKYNAYRSDDNKKLIIEVDNVHLSENISFPKLKSPVVKVEHKKISAGKVRISFLLDISLEDIKAISGYIKPKRFIIKLVGKYKVSDKDIIAKKYKVNKTIIIDPGHGGYDDGATGKYLQTKEKNITLLMAKELKESLEKSGYYKVILTRTGDQFISLDKRHSFAKSAIGDIFISLHADAHPDPRFRGGSVYTLSEEAFDNKKLLDLKHNKDNILTSNSQANISQFITDLVRRDAKNTSSHFANLTTDSLSKNIIMIKSAHRNAGLKVLNGVDIPAILIELGCLSNIEEEKLLSSYSYRAKIKQAIIVAINRYFTQNK